MLIKFNFQFEIRQDLVINLIFYGSKKCCWNHFLDLFEMSCYIFN